MHVGVEQDNFFFVFFEEGVMKTKWLLRSNLLEFFVNLHPTDSLGWKVLPGGVHGCQFLLPQTTIAIDSVE